MRQADSVPPLQYPLPISPSNSVASTSILITGYLEQSTSSCTMLSYSAADTPVNASVYIFCAISALSVAHCRFCQNNKTPFDSSVI